LKDQRDGAATVAGAGKVALSVALFSTALIIGLPPGAHFFEAFPESFRVWLAATKRGGNEPVMNYLSLSVSIVYTRPFECFLTGEPGGSK
jgi:hypothetical protein